MASVRDEINRLKDWLDVLRAPGGQEQIGFTIERYIKELELEEVYGDV